MHPQPCVVEPLRERDRGAAIAIVEMAAQREHFDGVEAMCRDLDQVIPIEPLADIEMGGDSEHFTTTARVTNAAVRIAGTSRGSPSRTPSYAACIEYKPCCCATLSYSRTCRAL